MDADEFIAAARTRLADLIAPIGGGAGADVSYEPGFEAMKAEVDKMQALEGGRVDWESIASNATTILVEQSKDFRAVLYYGAARAKLGNVAGLFDGLLVLGALIETLWDPMYPALKRPRARGNLCPWFGETVAPSVDAWTPTLAERPLALALDKTFRNVDNELADKLGDAYPGMSNLRDAVRRMVQRIPAEAAPPPPPPPPPEPRAAPSAAADASPQSAPGQSYESAPASSSSGGGGGGFTAADITDEDSALRILQDLMPVLQRAAEVLRETDWGSPEGTRLNRVTSTLFLNAGLGEPGSETQVNPPDDDVVNTAASLAAGGDWRKLAALTESATVTNPVWFDGLYYLALAYQNEEKVAAQKVVESEAIALVHRSPGIDKLLFRGGTPFATDTAKQWLGGLAGPGGGGGGGASADKDGLGKAVARAREHIAAGEAPQAIAAIEKVAKSTASAVVRFRAKLEAAEISLLAGYADLARAQLDGLDRIAKAHGLEEWDPELAVRMYALLYRCQAQLGYFQSESLEQRARVAATWERLSQLDGAAALRTLLELG